MSTFRQKAGIYSISYQMCWSMSLVMVPMTATIAQNIHVRYLCDLNVHQVLDISPKKEIQGRECQRNEVTRKWGSLGRSNDLEELKVLMWKFGNFL